MPTLGAMAGTSAVRRSASNKNCGRLVGRSKQWKEKAFWLARALRQYDLQYILTFDDHSGEKSEAQKRCPLSALSHGLNAFAPGTVTHPHCRGENLPILISRQWSRVWFTASVSCLVPCNFSLFVHRCALHSVRWDCRSREICASGRPLAPPLCNDVSRKMGSPSSASFLREAPAHVDASITWVTLMIQRLRPWHLHSRSPLQAGQHWLMQRVRPLRPTDIRSSSLSKRHVGVKFSSSTIAMAAVTSIFVSWGLCSQVGQAPNEEQMKFFIEEVDIDRSGTIDFEEFCLLMMRQQRLTECPDWLYTMLHPPFWDDGVAEAAVASLPQVATLHDGKYEASQRIKRHMRLGKTGADADALASEADLVGSTTRYVEPKPGSASHRPPECADLSRDLLLTVCDLLPSTEHIKVAQLSGHHATFGPFVCQELLWRLCTSTRTTVEHLELAYDDLGDEEPSRSPLPFTS